MNVKKILWGTFITLASALVLYFGYQATKKEKKQLYKTSKFQKRDITHIINATGSIEAENTIKVGSLINGTVKELYVEENQEVKKDQLIALLDNGKGDTDVKRTKGLVKASEARVKYLKAFLERQRLMFEKGHISENDLELAESKYEEAVGQLDERKAAYEKAFIDYENIKILSPIDGVVIKKNVSLGEGVSSFLMPTVLYTIAQDLKKMKVELEIDETSIGYLKRGKEAILTFDTYPNHEFKGNIKEISNGPTISKGTVIYKSYIYISNDQLLLKPGMTVHADIIVNQKRNVFAVPGYIFSINPKMVEFVAKEKKYGYNPVSKEEFQAFKDSIENEDHTEKTIWIVKNKEFIEKPVEVGMTDKIFFEIVSGVELGEDIVIDVEETDVMKQMFKRLFGGGMSK
ncbi:efflux RND transporter periplasmic adaptor subunit [Candidatus Dependentiae bacterium]